MLSDPPSSAQVQRLPLNDPEWDWKAFERFCLGFVRAAPDVSTAHLYGTRGECQRGIDIEAHLSDGRTRTYQCRKWQRFRRGDAVKAVSDTTYEADEHVILVACEVGVPVRDYIATLNGWSILDAEDICHELRRLEPRERARRLVEDAFTVQWRRAFLGPTSSLAFLEPDEYFAWASDTSRLFRHTWTLVGRDELVDGLLGAIQDQRVRVVVLSGRGGVGKTRVLKEVAERLTTVRTVLFVDEHVPLTPETVEELPWTGPLVIVDDAHRRDDLGPLIRVCRRSADPPTVLLSTRPQGNEPLRDLLSRSGLDADEVWMSEPMAGLEYIDAYCLAKEALGAGQDNDVADKLAEVTSDCPLVTTVGGQLLASGELVYPAIGTDVSFRYAVLDRFRDEMLGRLGPDVDESLARNALVLLAALTPLSIEDAPTLGRIAEELGCEIHELRALVSRLEDAGLVLARGRLRRIVPDVLADHILHTACVDARGTPTGRSDALLARYLDVAPNAVVFGLAELDWRIGARAAGPLLLADFWEHQSRCIREGDASEQVRILELLTPIAAFAPYRALAIARDLVPADSPAMADEPHAEVLKRLPALLGAIAFSSDLAPEVLDLLWRVGRDDRRVVSEHEDHALRTIFALSRYGRGLSYALRSWAFIQRLLNDEDAVLSHVHSPIELMSPLLDRTGIDAPNSQGIWHSYHIDAERTAPLRAQVRAKLVDLAINGDPRSRVLAAEMLALALAEPQGYFGAPVAPRMLAQWHPDQRLILAAIEQVLAGSDDPHVRLTAVVALRWHGEHSSWPDVAETANKLARLDRTPRDELIWLLRGHATLGDGSDSFDHVVERVTPLVAAVEDPAAFAEELDRELSAMANTRLGGDPDAAPLLYAITTIDGKLAGSIALWCVRHPDRALARFAGALLAFLATVDLRAVHRVLQAVRRGDYELRRIVADYVLAVARYGSSKYFGDELIEQPRRRLRKPKPTPRLEAELLRQCLGDRDPQIVARALAAADLIGDADSALGARYLAHAQIGEDQALAEAFSIAGRTVAAGLDAAAATVFLDKLVLVPDLGDKCAGLLAEIGIRFPAAVYSCLVTRAKRGGEVTNRFLADYDGDFIGGASDAERRLMLRRLGKMAAAADTRQRQELSYVFCGLTSDLPARCNVLVEWVGHPDDRLADAAQTILEGMPWYTTLVCPDFVADALANAARRGPSKVADTKARLLGLATQCPQRDELTAAESDEIRTLRDEAKGHVERFAVGSPAALFFRELFEYAQEIIRAIELEEEEYAVRRR